MSIMEQLKKEKIQIILVNIFCFSLFSLTIFVSIKNDELVANLGTLILFGIIQAIMLIAYFDNKKDIRDYEKIIERSNNETH